jgi:arginase family enzyme
VKRCTVDASNLWSESGIDLGREDVFFEAGDVTTDEPKAIEDSVSALLAQELRPLVLGGDHSITYPIVKAVARAHPGLSILHFDAHPDLYDDFRGNPHSHASPFARIMEAKLAQRLVQVGIRTMNGHHAEQAERFGVEVIEMKDLKDGWCFSSTRRFMSRLIWMLLIRPLRRASRIGNPAA